MKSNADIQEDILFELSPFIKEQEAEIKEKLGCEKVTVDHYVHSEDEEELRSIKLTYKNGDEITVSRVSLDVDSSNGLAKGDLTKDQYETFYALFETIDSEVGSKFCDISKQIQEKYRSMDEGLEL